ncbi:endonuclease III domain-containing protein [Campylobacter concisus]|uniref:endonuclease III domain-containing protein n=1 Tax=Campylobacter concisus TaxID=199 RepID=UPI000D31DA54|nr:endonuclease III [Campylobacter concisus]QPH99239.1 endonuclease III [Campylobacter concisus]QPI01035.1 endonuclease III [Campylobacter concisus]
MTSTDLFLTLFNHKNKNLDELKWPDEGTFGVILGAILVQNTNWKNVEKALDNLKKANKDSLQGICELENSELATLIKPSGFYNTKAKRLKTLCQAIRNEFDDFENFKENVSREWLISVKGVGAETCDAILAYACGKPYMVVDAYALRIMAYFDYIFESYDEAAEWFSSLDYDEIYKILDSEKFDEIEILKLYHALILEFCKENFKGKILSQNGQKILSSIKN